MFFHTMSISGGRLRPLLRVAGSEPTVPVRRSSGVEPLLKCCCSSTGSALILESLARYG
eukprot:00857_6